MMRSRWRACFIFSFFKKKNYLPVTQVELSRCIVGSLEECIPSFLWLRIDHGGLAAVMQLSAAVGEAFYIIYFSKTTKLST